MDNNLLEIKLPLVGNVEILINHPILVSFAQRQLRNYIVGQKSFVVSKEYRTIIQTDNEAIIQKLSGILQSEHRLSREIEITDGVLRIKKNWRLAKVTYVCFISKGILTLETTIHFRFSADLLKRMLGRKYSFSHQLFYDLLLYPIFSLYALADNYYLIHGSLIQKNNEYIVISGLDGVGKSTLSNILDNEGYPILADNFLLFNGNQAIPFNMPIRIKHNDAENGLEVIYRDKYIKEVLPKQVRYDPVDVNRIFILSISKDLQLRCIRKKDLNQYWNMISNCADEINAANRWMGALHFINLFNLASFDSITSEKEIKFYLLNVPKGELEKGKETILECD